MLDLPVAPFFRNSIAASTAAVRFDRCGSLLLGASAIPAEVVSAGSHERVSAEFAVERVPLLAGGVVEDVLYSPADGLVEVDGLLQWFLARARDGGATIATGLGPARPHVVRDRVEGVILQHDRVSTRQLVVAAGGWSSDWGAMANIPIELEPRRRHIVCTEEPPESRTVHRAGGEKMSKIEEEVGSQKLKTE